MLCRGPLFETTDQRDHRRSAVLPPAVRPAADHVHRVDDPTLRHRPPNTAASWSTVSVQPLWKFSNSSGGSRECSMDIRVSSSPTGSNATLTTLSNVGLDQF